jgi:hypothetical protein
VQEGIGIHPQLTPVSESKKSVHRRPFHDGTATDRKRAAAKPRSRDRDSQSLHLPRLETDYERDVEGHPLERLGPKGRSDNDEVCVVWLRLQFTFVAIFGLWGGTKWV